jgi:hypothetical protein
MESIDMSNIVGQIKNILTKPKDALQSVRNVGMEFKDLLIYLAVVGLPTLIGLIFGYGFIYGYAIGIRFSLGWAISSGFVQYIMLIVGIVILGVIINELSPHFSSKKDFIQALKAAAYMATPSLVAGILYLYPPLSPLVLVAGLYGLYILYLGLPILMETPSDKTLLYFIVILVLYYVIMILISSVSGMMLGTHQWFAF